VSYLLVFTSPRPREHILRAYYRPGATPLERLETLVALYLCSRPGIPERVADLLVRATGCGTAREVLIREAFSSRSVPDPAEALGMARALLLLCGVAPEHGQRLSGQPREDFARLLEGQFPHPDLASPESYAVPSLLEAYCHMGSGFARGVDRVFRAVTGRPLVEHLRRALALLERSPVSEASSS